jgi:hypothetical protein
MQRSHCFCQKPTDPGSFLNALPRPFLGGFHLAIDVKPDAKLGGCQMTQGNLFDTRIAGTSWWRCACNGVPVWRWPSNL